jgi:hypothetical protein
MPGASILQTLQKIATVVHWLDSLAEDLRELRTAVSTRIERLEGRWLTCAKGSPVWRLPARLIVLRCKLIWHASAQR